MASVTADELSRTKPATTPQSGKTVPDAVLVIRTSSPLGWVKATPYVQLLSQVAPPNETVPASLSTATLWAVVTSARYPLSRS
jgi:hypothetical protein